MTKTVYQTNLAGFFVCETVADESPLEPGVYHYPAGTVTVAPPEVTDPAQAARWNGSAWDVVRRPPPTPQPSALDKLQEFLKANPDVQQLLNK